MRNVVCSYKQGFGYRRYLEEKQNIANRDNQIKYPEEKEKTHSHIQYFLMTQTQTSFPPPSISLFRSSYSPLIRSCFIHDHILSLSPPHPIKEDEREREFPFPPAQDKKNCVIRR